VYSRSSSAGTPTRAHLGRPTPIYRVHLSTPRIGAAGRASFGRALYSPSLQSSSTTRGLTGCSR
jgi:hypothetical protein